MIGYQILFALWLFWPAGVATLMPVLVAHAPLLSRWDLPMDMNKQWRGRRILGNHKTWRGFLAGWIGGSLWVWVQTIIYAHSNFVHEIYPTGFNPSILLSVGILISLGAVVGDAVGSFFKRQLDIPSGRSWFPYDQIDFVVGGILFSLAVVRLHWSLYLMIILTWLCVHLLFGWLGYLTKVKPEII